MRRLKRRADRTWAVVTPIVVATLAVAACSAAPTPSQAPTTVITASSTWQSADALSDMVAAATTMRDAPFSLSGRRTSAATTYRVEGKIDFSHNHVELYLAFLGTQLGSVLTVIQIGDEVYLHTNLTVQSRFWTKFELAKLGNRSLLAWLLTEWRLPLCHGVVAATEAEPGQIGSQADYTKAVPVFPAGRIRTVLNQNC
jgi:hypothetical protein